ncbi:hypothetical protein Ddye_006251 [Dipteronia dyeriana]|uniref:Uncharacterized protein n=1 Tax=Dipteronia dyeriana TaxID=168575 RepID=A0AAD9XI40_9ROSI|nr:hypothetical protein Ddye_006251 [Dipteronia dyeriana]
MILDENATVDALKTDSGGWNIELLQNNFLAGDVDKILSIPPLNPFLKTFFCGILKRVGNIQLGVGRVAKELALSINPSMSGLKGREENHN